MYNISDLHKKLGLNLENGLFIRKDVSQSPNSSIKDLYKGDFSNYKSNFKVEYSLKKLNPNSFFLFNNEPLLIFFDYSNDIQNEKIKLLSNNIWNFNKSALVFLNQPEELVIYNGFHYEKTGLLQVFETIKTVTDEHKLNNYSYIKVISGELWQTWDAKFRTKNRVDTKLLENIQDAREVLIDNKYLKNPLSERYANRIIGRLIFTRYLIDRKVYFDYNGNGKELLTKEKLPELILKKEDLYDFFKYLLKKFKGDLLPLNGEQNAIDINHLEILSNLFAGATIKSNQMSLFNVFDFDFIPIELISNIYETFLGEKQDTDKAFYSPPFLVDYILEQTVKPFILAKKDPDSIHCKTVDFTCGSGIFLCETLRALINRYIQLEKPNKSTIKFKNKIKRLVKENIFGNDINPEALEIAKFSLFITLLDYFEDPKDIENFEFPNISKNFYSYDVFDKKLDIIFGKGKIVEPDFIIGNPPWGEIKKSCYLEYCRNREEIENKKKRNLWEKQNHKTVELKPIELEISNNEFAQAFLLRLSDFSTYKTICHIIVTSKLLYNLNAMKFRTYFLNNFFLKEILEISSVRHQIFVNAIGPAVIIKYKYSFGKDTKENSIDYVSLKPNPFFAIFKTILIEKTDYKEVIQNELIENDWLWKVLVYGHILDYSFIKCLRERKKYPLRLGDLIDDDNDKNKELFISTGIIIGNKENDASQYKGMYFINTDSKRTKRPSDLKRFYSYIAKDDLWNEDKAERPRDESIFRNPPTLLIKKGLSQSFEIIASIVHIPCIFPQSIYGIKSKIKDSLILGNILGIISSDFARYYIMMCGSSTGVEREQLINNELRPIPFITSMQIAQISNDLIKIQRILEYLKRKDFPEQEKIFQYQELFNQTESKLNYFINELYTNSETEKDLISYCTEITIPVLQGRNKRYNEIKRNPSLFKPYEKITDIEIKEYINIFKKHFSLFHNGNGNGFINARIYMSEKVLAIDFYIDKESHSDIWFKEVDNLKTIELVIGLGFQRVSNELFIQKDIKTLNGNSFSIIKLNQYKYWHKAIARLDIVEISEAMIQSQLRIPNDKD